MAFEHTFNSQKPLTDEWNTFRERIAKFSQYTFAADPELLLRRGLIEEAREIAMEKASDHFDKKHLTGEIGDSLFYLSHIAKISGDLEINVDNAQEIPVYSIDNGALTPIHDPMDKTLIGMLRVCDKMNPHMERLWKDEHGNTVAPDDRPTMQHTIESAFASLQSLAIDNDIDLVDAMQATADKLDTRAREPHVIEEDRDQRHTEKQLTSSRERAISSLSKRSLREAFLHEVDSLHNSESE